MENMDYLFKEFERREQELAGIRTGRFKTALDSANEAQFAMMKKIIKSEAEKIIVGIEQPRGAKEVKIITIYRKNEPQRRVDLSRVEALRLIGELKEALKL